MSGAGRVRLPPRPWADHRGWMACSACQVVAGTPGPQEGGQVLALVGVVSSSRRWAGSGWPGPRAVDRGSTPGLGGELAGVQGAGVAVQDAAHHLWVLACPATASPASSGSAAAAGPASADGGMPEAAVGARPSGSGPPAAPRRGSPPRRARRRAGPAGRAAPTGRSSGSDRPDRNAGTAAGPAPPDSGSPPFQGQHPAAAGPACRHPTRHDLVEVRWSAPVARVPEAAPGCPGRSGGPGSPLEHGAAWRWRPAQPLHLTAQPLVVFWSRSRSAPAAGSRRRAARIRPPAGCCAWHNPAFCSSSRARRQRNPPGPAGPDRSASPWPPSTRAPKATTATPSLKNPRSQDGAACPWRSPPRSG